MLKRERLTRAVHFGPPAQKFISAIQKARPKVFSMNEFGLMCDRLSILPSPMPTWDPIARLPFQQIPEIPGSEGMLKIELLCLHQALLQIHQNWQNRWEDRIQSNVRIWSTLHDLCRVPDPPISCSCKGGHLLMVARLL